jgi:hypothetical protein
LRNDKVAFDKGTKFLTGWAHFASTTERAPFSKYWRQFNDSENTDPNNSAAERDWAKYAATFKATQMDRLIIEEAAKMEGQLRMVLDETTGLVISLGEYSRRTLNRFLSNRPGNLNDSVHSAKRKLDDGIMDVDGQVGKKTRLEM